MQTQLPKTLRQLLSELDAQGVTKAQRYAAVRKYLNFKAREKNRPITGAFELTPLCNLDCRMCYVHLTGDQLRGRRLLTTAQWQDIMQQSIDAGMMYASLTGGECLTYPGFKTLYLFLQERGVEVNILTNGVLMDAEMAAFLTDHPPARVQITLYGASEDAYERVTGRRMFEVVWQNIRRLKNAGIPLSIAVTPNGFMQDGEDIIRLLHGEGLPFVINAGLLMPREDTGRGLADANLEAYVGMTRLQMALQGRRNEEDVPPESLPDPGGEAASGEAACGVSCGAGRSCFAVDWQGGLRPCNNFPCAAENVIDLGFAEAWRRVNRIATTFRCPAECQGCAWHAVCKHCVAEHAAGAPIGHANPAVCAWARRMTMEGLLSIDPQAPSIDQGRREKA